MGGDGQVHRTSRHPAGRSVRNSADDPTTGRDAVADCRRPRYFFLNSASKAARPGLTFAAGAAGRAAVGLAPLLPLFLVLAVPVTGLPVLHRSALLQRGGFWMAAIVPCPDLFV